MIRTANANTNEHFFFSWRLREEKIYSLPYLLPYFRGAGMSCRTSRGRENMVNGGSSSLSCPLFLSPSTATPSHGATTHPPPHLSQTPKLTPTTAPATPTTFVTPKPTIATPIPPPPPSHYTSQPLHGYLHPLRPSPYLRPLCPCSSGVSNSSVRMFGVNDEPVTSFHPRVPLLSSGGELWVRGGAIQGDESRVRGGKAEERERD